MIAGVQVDDTTHDGHRRLRLTAVEPLVGIATRHYTRSAVTVDVGLGVYPDGGGDAEYLGFAFTQFALPVTCGAALDFDFAPADNLHAPEAVLPLLVRHAGRCTLLAPLAHPHEQVITVHDGVIRWGWHGDLDEVPEGFVTELGVYEAATPAEVLAAWAADLHGADGPIDRAVDPVTTHLSYWTDNGAAYWYRTEEDRTITESVAEAVETLRRDGVPVVGVELDSWFYDHEVPRPIAEIGYPEEVPPSGAMRWEPRADAFPTVDADDPDPADPIERFAERLGRPPLILHARHISPASPYVDADWWTHRAAAHPSDPAFFRRWFDDAARWGATCIEQDWMLMYWFGVRSLRSTAGRALAWQRSLNDHARATGVDLMWCMATPADLIEAAHLDRVVAVRTSDDYRFAADPAFLWTWYLTVNRLADVLGLPAFKDCFFSNPDVEAGGDPIDGDVHAELEALLSAMSAGPVGIGDRIGRTNRSIVMRTCDDDGRLLQPDRPIGLVDDCLFGAPARGERLAWATTSSTLDTPSGAAMWTYVVAINMATERRTITDTLDLRADLGLDLDPTAVRTVYDWRQATSASRATIEVELAPREWALYVVCPPGESDPGDPTKYVTVTSGARHQV